MRNHGLVALAVALVVGLTLAEAQGGPRGRRSGGPRPSGIRSGNVRPQNLTQPLGVRTLNNSPQPGSRNLANNAAGGNFQNKVSQLKTNFTPVNQPFTPAWYANHPQAWQYTHPHADAWAVATLGTAAAWLGVAAATDGGYAADSGTVYTADTTDDTGTDEQTDSDVSAAQQAGAYPAPNPWAPGSVARRNNAAAAGNFLPLGVFALAPQNEKDASALLQLALDRQGNVYGNYYDVLSGRDQPISGKVDGTTQKATFFVVPAGNVSFHTTLASLTQPTGSIQLQFQDGRTRQWTLARFQDPATGPPTN